MAQSGTLDRDGTTGYATNAFLATRAPFHLAYRLTDRLFQIAAPDGGARTAPWQLALLAFATLDVALSAILKKPERFCLRTRLVLDSADIALWSLAPYPDGRRYPIAVLIALPLALEAGLQLRFKGLIVPASALTATAVARSLAHLPIDPQNFLWLVLGVACGVLLQDYLLRLDQQSYREWAQRRSAEHRKAYVAGQNAVAMGASSVVDAIEGVVPILGRPESGSALERLADAWKPALYESTLGHAAYLGQVLAEWSAQHNRHPDLASQVHLNLPEGTGTTLLTVDQAVVLGHRLSSLDLVGSIPVDLTDEAVSQRPPGGPLSLNVGPHTIDLPADADQPPRACDPGPAAFILAALLMLSDLIQVPLTVPSVIPGITFSLAAAWWAHRVLRRRGRAAWPAIMIAATVVALTHTAAAAMGIVHPLNHAGVENYPIVVAIDLLALLGGMYWDGLPAANRWATIAAALAVVGLGWALHPTGHHPEIAAVLAMWGLPLMVGARRLQRELDSHSRRYARELTDHDGEAQAAAFTRGMSTVIDLVRQARDEAHQHLTAIHITLPAKLAANVRQRLDEVDRRLESIAAHQGPPPSPPPAT